MTLKENMFRLHVGKKFFTYSFLTWKESSMDLYLLFPSDVQNVMSFNGISDLFVKCIMWHRFLHCQLRNTSVSKIKLICSLVLCR